MANLPVFAFVLVELLLLLCTVEGGSTPPRHDHPNGASGDANLNEKQFTSSHASETVHAAPSDHFQIDRGPVKKEHWKTFLCEVCTAFAFEFSKKMEEKTPDHHHTTAIHYSRGNTSNYQWEERLQKLMPHRSPHGIAAINTIYQVLDHMILDHYVVDVVLHALAATAHRHNPARLRHEFARDVLCVEETLHCPSGAKSTGSHQFSVSREDYNHFHTAFISQWETEHHPRRKFGRRVRDEELHYPHSDPPSHVPLEPPQHPPIDEDLMRHEDL